MAAAWIVVGPRQRADPVVCQQYRLSASDLGDESRDQAERRRLSTDRGQLHQRQRRASKVGKAAADAHLRRLRGVSGRLEQL